MTLDEILIDLWCHVRTADEARDLVEGLMFRELHDAEAAEREACAKVCEKLMGRHRASVFNEELAYVAAAIRSRGEKIQEAKP